MSDDATPVPAGPRRYSAKLRHKEVEVETADGQVHLLHVTELTGLERDNYLDWVARQMPKYDAAGKMTEPRQFHQHQANLIQRCLRTAAGARNPFSVDTIQQWAASTQEGLFLDCQEICSFDREAMDRAKKDSTGTAGSGST